MPFGERIDLFDRRCKTRARRKKAVAISTGGAIVSLDRRISLHGEGSKPSGSAMSWAVRYSLRGACQSEKEGTLRAARSLIPVRPQHATQHEVDENLGEGLRICGSGSGTGQPLLNLRQIDSFPSSAELTVRLE